MHSERSEESPSCPNRASLLPTAPVLQGFLPRCDLGKTHRGRNEPFPGEVRILSTHRDTPMCLPGPSMAHTLGEVGLLTTHLARFEPFSTLVRSPYGK